MAGSMALRIPAGAELRRALDPAEPSEATVLPSHGLTEAAVNIQSDDAHAPPPSGGRREMADNTTPTDPRSRRIRESREGRPCNELGLSADCLSTACPQLGAPCAPRPGWAHHKAVPLQKQQDEQGATSHIPDNGMVERFNGRIEDVLQSRGFCGGEDLEQTILRYVHLYNDQLPRSVLKGRTPTGALKGWHGERPELFKKQRYDHAGCDT